MKNCTKCKKNKELEAFVKSKQTLDGRKTYCKECHNIKAALNRYKRPDLSKVILKENIRRKPYRAHKKSFCEECGFVAIDSCQLHVDHVDGDSSNNVLTNLKTLCANCHALKSKLSRDVGRKRKYEHLMAVV